MKPESIKRSKLTFTPISGQLGWTPNPTGVLHGCQKGTRPFANKPNKLSPNAKRWIGSQFDSHRQSALSATHCPLGADWFTAMEAANFLTKGVWIEGLSHLQSAKQSLFSQHEHNNNSVLGVLPSGNLTEIGRPRGHLCLKTKTPFRSCETPATVIVTVKTLKNTQPNQNNHHCPEAPTHGRRPGHVDSLRQKRHSTTPLEALAVVVV